MRNNASDDFIDPSEMGREQAKNEVDRILHINIYQEIATTFNNQKFIPYKDWVPADSHFIDRFIAIIWYKVDNPFFCYRLNDTYYDKVYDSLESMYALSKAENKFSTANLTNIQKTDALINAFNRDYPNEFPNSMDQNERDLFLDYFNKYKELKERNNNNIKKLMLYYMRAQYFNSFINKISDIDTHRKEWCDLSKEKIKKALLANV